MATFVPQLEDDLVRWGKGEAVDSGQEQALNIEEVDRGCEDCACLIQYIESYDSFLKHCCQEVGRASELRRARGGEGSAAASGAGSPILPAITELGEAAIELGAILSGGEQALLLASIYQILVSPTSYESFEEGSGALCSNFVEEIFYAAQRSALRAVASGHEMTTCVVLNTCSNTLYMVVGSALKGRRTSRASQQLMGLKGYISAAVLENVAGVASDFNNLRKGLSSAHGDEAEEVKVREKQRKLAEAGAAFNDYKIAVVYFGKLQEMLQDEITEGGEELIDADSQLSSAVRSFATAKRQLAEEDPLLKMSGELGGVVRGIVEKAGEAEACTYEITEEGFELGEATGGWTGAVCAEVERIVRAVAEWLSVDGAQELWRAVLEELTKRVEIVLRKKRYTDYGALRLDADVRALTVFVKSHLGDGAGPIVGLTRLKQATR